MFSTVPNEELTEPVIKSVVGVVGIAVNSVALIAGVADDVKLNEPVPSAKIPKIVPNEELIWDISSSDADRDEVVWIAPKILYGELNPYPLVELLANKVGKLELPLSTILLTKVKSAATSSAASSDESSDVKYCNSLVTFIPASVFNTVISGNPSSNPLFRVSTIIE